MKDSLYDQIKMSLLLSELTYALSLIRELGRKNQLEGDDNMTALKIPLNAAEFQRIIQNNPQLTSIFESQNEDATMQFSAVDEMKENERKLMRRSIMGQITDMHSDVVFFKDQPDKGYREQTEMVFGITVNRNKKRVTIVFRGSRTPADWAANRKFDGLAVPNPVKNLDEFTNVASLPDEVCFHKGFYEYLHRKDETGVGVFEILMPILEQYPGYSLNVAGHSLGGALASIFAVEAACRNDIIKPVKCITHAQPLVGDIRLLQSVRMLETSGNLLLLRTRNSGDGVPSVPAFSKIPSFTYTHIGMELKLYDDDKSKRIKIIKSEMRVRNFFLNFKAMMILFVIKAGKDKQRRNHSLTEYLRRLEKCKEEIRSLGETLEDIYSGVR